MEQHHVENILANLERLPLLRTLISKEWVREKTNERRPLSTLIWMLTTPPYDYFYRYLYQLESNLNTIDFNSLQHAHIEDIKKRLKSKYEKDVIGVITELDVFAFFTRNNIPIVYEPSINNHTKNPDFYIILNKDKIYVEVFTLFKSQEDKDFENPITQLQQQIKKIKLPYHVSLGIDNLPMDKIKEVKNFVYNAMKDEKEGTIDTAFPFVRRINLNKRKDGINRVIVSCHWNSVGDYTSRLRKVLQREAAQLPKNHKNLLIVNLFNFADDIEFYNALAGEEMLRFYVPKNPNEKFPEPDIIRNKSNRFLQPYINRRVNYVVGYKHFFNSERWMLPHPNPDFPFSKEENEIMERLFLPLQETSKDGINKDI